MMQLSSPSLAGLFAVGFIVLRHRSLYIRYLMVSLWHTDCLISEARWRNRRARTSEPTMQQRNRSRIARYTEPTDQD